MSDNHWTLQQLSICAVNSVKSASHDNDFKRKLSRFLFLPHSNIWPEDVSNTESFINNIHDNVGKDHHLSFKQVCLASFLLTSNLIRQPLQPILNKFIPNPTELGIPFEWSDLTSWEWKCIAVALVEVTEKSSGGIYYAILGMNKKNNLLSAHWSSVADSALNITAKQAVEIAFNIARSSNRSATFFFWPILPPSISIEGPSLGLSVYLGCDALLQDYSIPNILVTGEILPNGTIKEVEDLKKKYDAAKDHDFEGFLYPWIKGDDQLHSFVHSSVTKLPVNEINQSKYVWLQFSKNYGAEINALITTLESNYSTTPLVIAYLLKLISRTVFTIDYFLKCKKILDMILECCSNAYKLPDNSQVLFTLYDIGVFTSDVKDDFLYLYKVYDDQIHKIIEDDNAHTIFIHSYNRLESIIKWFIETIYPSLLHDDYAILFESENCRISPEAFNQATIDFNVLFFGEGSSRLNADEYIELNNINPFLHLYAVSRYTHDVIGALEVYPLTDSFLGEFETSDNCDVLLSSDSIPKNDIRTFDEPGIYKLFVDTIATHPQFRGTPILLKRLLETYLNMCMSLTERNICFSDIYAEAWTKQGIRLAEALRMKKVRNTLNGTLYKLPLTDLPKINPKLLPSNFNRFIKLNTHILNKLSFEACHD